MSGIGQLRPRHTQRKRPGICIDAWPFRVFGHSYTSLDGMELWAAASDKHNGGGRHCIGGHDSAISANAKTNTPASKPPHRCLSWYSFLCEHSDAMSLPVYRTAFTIGNGNGNGNGLKKPSAAHLNQADRAFTIYDRQLKLMRQLTGTHLP